MSIVNGSRASPCRASPARRSPVFSHVEFQSKEAVGPSWKETAFVLQVHGLQPSGRIRGIEAMEVAGRRSTPPPGGSLSSPPRQVRSARVRPPNLF
jgi:hypothetical protein